MSAFFFPFGLLVCAAMLLGACMASRRSEDLRAFDHEGRNVYLAYRYFRIGLAFWIGGVVSLAVGLAHGGWGPIAVFTLMGVLATAAIVIVYRKESALPFEARMAFWISLCVLFAGISAAVTRSIV